MAHTPNIGLNKSATLLCLRSMKSVLYHSKGVLHTLRVVEFNIFNFRIQPRRGSEKQ